MGMKRKILIAEDEPNLRKLIKNYLQREGFEITEASDGREALEKFTDEEYALVLLDIMMPYMDGFAVCREIRKLSSVPIVFLTAKSQEYDELSGFDCGADEYITKPFSPAVLVKRVKAVLRRSGALDADKINFAGITLLGGERRVESDGETISLTPREYELLAYFIRNRNIALSREVIIENVWGYDYEGDDRTVDTHIKCLRNKLGNNGKSLRTIRKLGYMLTDREPEVMQ
ncbi:MAG: response regulator transcription factor [Saccharofermentanales bacterium]